MGRSVSSIYRIFAHQNNTQPHSKSEYIVHHAYSKSVNLFNCSFAFFCYDFSSSFFETIKKTCDKIKSWHFGNHFCRSFSFVICWHRNKMVSWLLSIAQRFSRRHEFSWVLISLYALLSDDIATIFDSKRCQQRKKQLESQSTGTE